MASETLLEMRKVIKQFGGLTAVSEFELTIVSEDKIVGLIGPNGAGKTTVFNLITGVYQPTAGEIRVGGVHTAGFTPDRIASLGVARTFQNIRLFEQMTVLENVKTAFNLRKDYGLLDAVLRTRRFRQAEEAIEEEALELLRILNLAELISERADSLAYGQQRRLEIARALALRPKLLILDEPAAGVNPAETEVLMDMLHAIRERFDLSLLLIEHDMKFVMRMCERIVVLDYGEIIATGSPDEVRSNPEVIKAYLGDSADDIDLDDQPGDDPPEDAPQDEEPPGDASDSPAQSTAPGDELDHDRAQAGQEDSPEAALINEPEQSEEPEPAGQLEEPEPAGLSEGPDALASRQEPAPAMHAASDTDAAQDLEEGMVPPHTEEVAPLSAAELQAGAALSGAPDTRDLAPLSLDELRSSLRPSLRPGPLSNPKRMESAEYLPPAGIQEIADRLKGERDQGEERAQPTDEEGAESSEDAESGEDAESSEDAAQDSDAGQGSDAERGVDAGQGGADLGGEPGDGDAKRDEDEE